MYWRRGPLDDAGTSGDPSQGGNGLFLRATSAIHGHERAVLSAGSHPARDLRKIALATFTFQSTVVGRGTGRRRLCSCRSRIEGSRTGRNEEVPSDPQ